MQKPYEQDFFNLLRPLFPGHADFRQIASESEICFLIDWKLNVDQSRPSKRSRKIIIRFCQETLEDYVSARPQIRLVADNRIKQFVAQRMAGFDPNHDTPYGFPEPREEWLILTNMVNI